MTSAATNVHEAAPPQRTGAFHLPRAGGLPATGKAALLIFAVSIALLLLALAVGWIVRQSMRETARKSLQSVLAANVSSLELWLSQRNSDAENIVGDAEVARLSRSILNRFAGRSELDADTLASSPDAQLLDKQLSAAAIKETYLGWALLDTSGRIVASDQTGLVAKRFAIPKDSLEQLDLGRGMICRPIRSPVQLAAAGPLSHSGAAVMFAIAPISEGLRTLGGLALLIDPLDQFSKILAVSRSGQTDETFAFDRSGTLLSQSRFEHVLRRTGLLGSEPDSASPLNLRLVDPGSDLTSVSSPVPLAQAPLTLMADQATRGGTGANVLGYHNYLGVRVIGAWQWLPAHDFCIGTEVQYAEAFAPLRMLRNGVLGALALILLGGLGALMLSGRQRGDRPSATELSRRLGQYELGEVIGRGGMGKVYHGRHHLLQRDVAVKVLEHTEVTTRSLSRFEREVQLTAKLRHPNTIEIYDYGRTAEGTFFYVMEYVAGISLQQLIDQYGRQPAERVIYLLLQICGSISEAHQQSLVHRDIKPANILLTARAGLYDLVKVLDFGLVKEIDRNTLDLTRSGAVTGTPLYMSPEVVRDASKADPRSDLYSIGAVGYTLLTGLTTFDGESAADICAKHLNAEPIRPADRIGHPLSDDLQNVLMSCLRKNAEDRPASADELADALLQCRDAGHWTIVDACQWWEAVFDGPRDDLDGLRDNSRPAATDRSPRSKRHDARAGHHTQVTDQADGDLHPLDEPS
jgi:serine/threonine-protein kinase